jgi:hypothetical protein
LDARRTSGSHPSRAGCTSNYRGSECRRREKAANRLANDAALSKAVVVVGVEKGLQPSAARLDPLFHEFESWKGRR